MPLLHRRPGRPGGDDDHDRGRTSSRRTRSCRRCPRSSGASSPSSSCFLVLWKFAYPAINKIMQARTEHHPRQHRRGRTGPQRRRDDPRRVPAPAGRRPQRGQPHHRGGPSGRRAVAPRPGPAGRGRGGRAAPAQHEPTCVAAQERIVGQLQSQVRTLAIDLAERVVGANLDRDQNLRLVDQFVAELNAQPAAERRPGPVMSDADRRRLRRRPLRDRQGRGHPRHRRGRAVQGGPHRSRPTTTCAPPCCDDAIPIERRVSAWSRRLLGGRVSPITTALVSFVVGRRPGRGTSPRSSTSWSPGPPSERHEAVAEVRTAYPLDDAHMPASWPRPSVGPPASTCRSR